MPLKKLSYNKAKSIIELYSSLLTQLDAKTDFGVYGFSELKGYTIIDIDNSLKLQLAYEVFNSNIDEVKVVERIKQTANSYDSAVFLFFSTFVPDETIPEIEKLDTSDKNYTIDCYRLVGHYENHYWQPAYSKQEGFESFLKFCLQLGKDDIDFWEKVYERLELVMDTNESRDPINIIIADKKFFFKSLQSETSLKLSEVTDNPDKTTSFIKEILVTLSFSVLIGMSIFFSKGQNIILGLVAILGGIKIVELLITKTKKWVYFSYIVAITTLACMGFINSKIKFYLLLFFAVVIPLEYLIRELWSGKRFNKPIQKHY